MKYNVCWVPGSTPTPGATEIPMMITLTNEDDDYVSLQISGGS